VRSIDRFNWPLRRSVAFGIGLLFILVAADGPPDVLAESSFSAHMVQHLLIQIAAAPALLLGAPVILLLRADLRWFPRKRLAGALRSSPARTVSHPVVAFTIFATVLVGSHFTSLYDLALRLDWAHQMEHAAYLLSALLFWWPVIGTGTDRQALSYPLRLLYLFLIMPVMAFVGVAITSSQRVLYPHYLDHRPPWGAAPLADQHAAGALMWESGILAVTPALAVILLAWLNQDDRDQARRERLQSQVGTAAPVGLTRQPPADL
jgi:cytochrome c oxidase assembly factor CtaG